MALFNVASVLIALFNLAMLVAALLLCSCTTTTPPEGKDLPEFPHIEFEPLD